MAASSFPVFSHSCPVLPSTVWDGLRKSSVSCIMICLGYPLDNLNVFMPLILSFVYPRTILGWSLAADLKFQDTPGMTVPGRSWDVLTFQLHVPVFRRIPCIYTSQDDPGMGCPYIPVTCGPEDFLYTSQDGPGMSLRSSSLWSEEFPVYILGCPHIPAYVLDDSLWTFQDGPGMSFKNTLL